MIVLQTVDMESSAAVYTEVLLMLAFFKPLLTATAYHGHVITLFESSVS